MTISSDVRRASGVFALCSLAAALAVGLSACSRGGGGIGGTASDASPTVVQANDAIAAMLKEKASDTLDKVLFELSSQMKNAYSRSDA